MDSPSEDTENQMDVLLHESGSVHCEGNTVNTNSDQYLREAMNDPRLQNVLEEMMKSLNEIAEIMARSEIMNDPDSWLSRLYRAFQELCNFQCPETRTIGLIGNTGVGKSFLLSSILGEDGLARSKNDGRACTSVVVEYRAVDDHIDKPYTLEVDYMTPEQMRGLLRELLQGVRHYHFRVETAAGALETGDSMDEPDNSYMKPSPRTSDDPACTLTQQQVSELKLASDSAKRTLDALFNGQHDLTMEFLSGNNNPNSEAEVLDELVRMATAGLSRRPGQITSGYFIMTSNDAEVCKRHLDLLTTDGRGNDPAIWPFIKLIRLYLDSPILKSGLVLADMPGLRDLNYVRQKATQLYIRDNCHVLGFVTKMDRCLDDSTIEETSVKFKPTFPKLIAVTGIDVISPHEYARDDTEEANHVMQLNDRISELDRSIMGCNSSMKKAQGPRKFEIMSRSLTLQEEKEKLDFERTKFIVENRIRGVTEEMATMRTRRNQKVFCVSNIYFRNYWKSEGKEAEMWTELSGIPDLRQYCWSLSAKARFETTSTFIRTTVPHGLKSLHLWTIPAFDERDELKAESVRNMLEGVEGQLRHGFLPPTGLVTYGWSKLIWAFTNTILQTISDFADEWKESCVLAGNKWSKSDRGLNKWPHGTVTAFCRHFGNHTTLSKRDDRWNEELLHPIVAKLEPRWFILMDWLDLQPGQFAKGVDESLEPVVQILNEQGLIPAKSSQGLLEAIKTRKQVIEEAFGKAIRKVKEEAEDIQYAMLSAEPLSSYIGDYMYPAYELCNDVEGKGGDRKRKNILAEYTGPRDPVGSYRRRAQAEFSQIVEEHFSDLQAEVSNLVESTVRDLHNVAAVDGRIPEAARDKEFAGVVSEKVELTDTLMKEAQGLVLELERKGFQGE